MKAFAVLIFALAPLVSPQNQSTQRPPQIEGAPDVSIPGYMLWGKDEPGSATFAIRVKNNGKKVIKGISWEHRLSFSSGKNKVNLSLDLNSGDMYLRPGEEQLVLSVINKVFDSVVARFPPERIRLMKVVYEDGLSWEHSDDGAKQSPAPTTAPDKDIVRTFGGPTLEPVYSI